MYRLEEGIHKGNHDRQTMIKSSRANGEKFFVGKRYIFAGNTLCISRKYNAFPAENSRQMPKTHLIIVCLRSGVPYANFDYFLSIESNRPPRRRIPIINFHRIIEKSKILNTLALKVKRS